MKQITVNETILDYAPHAYPPTYSIGRQGETGALKLVLNLDQDTASQAQEAFVFVRRPGENNVYQAAGVTFPSDAIEWVPDSIDTAIHGVGWCEWQILGTAGEVIYSAQARIIIEQTLGDIGEYPDAPEGWATALQELQNLVATYKEDSDSQDTALGSRISTLESASAGSDRNPVYVTKGTPTAVCDSYGMILNSPTSITRPTAGLYNTVIAGYSGAGIGSNVGNLNTIIASNGSTIDNVTNYNAISGSYLTTINNTGYYSQAIACNQCTIEGVATQAVIIGSHSSTIGAGTTLDKGNLSNDRNMIAASYQSEITASDTSSYDNNAIIGGQGLKITDASRMVVIGGRYNATTTGACLVVGGGSSETSRKDALVVTSSGITTSSLISNEISTNDILLRDTSAVNDDGTMLTSAGGISIRQLLEQKDTEIQELREQLNKLQDQVTETVNLMRSAQ